MLISYGTVMSNTQWLLDVLLLPPSNKKISQFCLVVFWMYQCERLDLSEREDKLPDKSKRAEERSLCPTCLDNAISAGLGKCY